MPVIDINSYNTDIFTRNEIILAATIISRVNIKIKEIDRKEIPKSIYIKEFGIVSILLVLKVTIEYSVGTLTYGYERMISLDESEELFNSLKDKVNMEIHGSAKRDDPNLNYSDLIFATTKKVEVKMAQNKSEMYVAQYNEMEKALIRAIHKGVGRQSAFANIIVGYDTKLGIMYYDESVINLGKSHKGCVSILEQVYIDFIAKLKNDGRYCPINVPISKEKTAIGWRDKERRYVNKVSFLTILNAIGRIDCEEKTNDNLAKTINVGIKVKNMIEFIYEKCEATIKLIGDNTRPKINVFYCRADDGNKLVIEVLGDNGLVKQLFFIKCSHGYQEFAMLYEKITGNKPKSHEYNPEPSGRYPLVIKYEHLAQLYNNKRIYIDIAVDFFNEAHTEIREEIQRDLVTHCEKNYPEIPKNILEDLDTNWLDAQRLATKNMTDKQYHDHLDMIAKNILNQYKTTEACVMKGISEFIQKDISSDLALGYDSLMERFKIGLQIFNETNRNIYLSLIEAKIALHALSKKYPDIGTYVHYENDKYVIKNTHIPTGGSTQTNYGAIGHYHVTIHMSTFWIGTDTYNALKDLHVITTEVIKIMKTIEDKCNGNPIKAYYTALNQK